MLIDDSTINTDIHIGNRYVSSATVLGPADLAEDDDGDSLEREKGR